jgi:competence protein ComGC
MDKRQIKSLMDKLRQPIHISYISKYILKLDDDETKKQLDTLISEGYIKESKLSQGYYVAI